MAEKANLSEQARQLYFEGDLYKNIDKELVFRPGHDLFAITADIRHYFFPLNITENYNDCIIHAINFALRTPYFTRREDAMKIVQRNRRADKKYWEKVAEIKTLGGLNPNYLKHFYSTDDGRFLSLKMVSEYQDLSSTSSEQLLQTSRTYIEKEDYNNVILVTYHQRQDWGHYNHAVTLLKYHYGNKTTMLFLDVSNIAKGKIYDWPSI